MFMQVRLWHFQKQLPLGSVAEFALSHMPTACLYDLSLPYCCTTAQSSSSGIQCGRRVP